MKEKNQETLQDALKRLSAYQPKEEIWGSLESQLNQEEGKEADREQLSAAISRLPRYRAPQKIWQGIERRLAPRTRSLRSRWAIAAVIAGLMMASITGWMLIGNDSAPFPFSTVSEKKTEAPLKLPEAERATYGEELREVHLAIEACLDTLESKEAKVYKNKLSELEKLPTDSLHLAKARQLQQKVCDQ